MGKGKNEVYVEGKIIAVLPNVFYKVQLENDIVIVAYVSGKMRMHYIKILPGDKVRVAMSPYDLQRGRIVYRY